MPPRRDQRLVPYLAIITTAIVLLISKWLNWPLWAVAIGGIAIAAGAVFVFAGREHAGRRVTVGRVPVPAPAFQPRTGVQAQISDARAAGADVVLHGTGGTGTTQLAASLAGAAPRQGADIVVWIDAGGPGAVVTAFALAAHRVGAAGTGAGEPDTGVGEPGAGADAAADARAFVAWLADTDRRWLVVLDGVTDPVAIDPWWPAGHSATGWFLVTTMTDLVRHPVFGRGTAVEVGVFSPAESHEYLADRRLAGEGAAELAAELDHQPLALARAAAYMEAERVGCTDYLNRWIDRRKTVADPATAAILLAVDAAGKRALPALRLAAVLDPAGQPAAVWKNAAVARYLADGGSGTADAGMRAVVLLHRYGLVDHDRRLGAWAVRVHPDTAHTVRNNTPANLRDAAARTAADAVLGAWPDDDAYPHHAEAVQVLRANANTLARLDGDPLWQPAAHDLLWRAGSDIGVAEGLVRDRVARRGNADAHTLTARWILAASYRDAGRPADAARELEQVVSGYEALGHPGTGAARELLATVRDELP
jgi:hypothetical protein